MTNNKVASYAVRIERLLDERAAIDADIKDIYTEVKAADLKPKVLRKAIANKRRKTDKQFEAEVEEYAALLLALPGATYRGVSEQTGVSKSKLQRLVPKRARGTSTPRNVETGEITDSRAVEDDDGEQAGRGGAIVCRHSVDPPMAREPESEAGLAGEADAPAPITETAPDTPPSPAPEFGVGPGTESCGPCPVPPGSVPPTSDGNGLRTKGKAEPLADSPREHTLAGCNGVLAEQVTTTQSEDRASPGPQDPKPPAFSPEAREKLNSVAAAKPDLYQRITGAFKPLVRDDDDLIIPPFLRRSA